LGGVLNENDGTDETDETGETDETDPIVHRNFHSKNWVSGLTDGECQNNCLCPRNEHFVNTMVDL
jgi:hypothetical protein